MQKKYLPNNIMEIFLVAIYCLMLKTNDINNDNNTCIKIALNCTNDWFMQYFTNTVRYLADLSAAIILLDARTARVIWI